MISTMRNRLKKFGLRMFTMIVDCAFVAGWAALQYGVGAVLKTLAPDGLNVVVLHVFRFVFAISTVWPVIAFVTEDVCTIFIDLRQSLRGMFNNARGNLDD